VVLVNDCVNFSYYNEEIPHSGKYCHGKTPMQTFGDSKKLHLKKIMEKCIFKRNLTIVNLSYNMSVRL
jgi:hypothetical protein